MRTFEDYTRTFGVGIGREPEKFLAEAKSLIPMEVWDRAIEDHPLTFKLFTESLFNHFFIN